VWKKFNDELFDREKFVQQWECREKGIWSGQLLHSFAQVHMSPPLPNPKWHPKRQEFTWKIPRDFEYSIQTSYVRAIQMAERFIHIENQYFIGSGAYWGRTTVKNRIPEALVRRILKKKGENFHVYVVLPMVPEGAVVPAVLNATLGVRNLEFQTMAWMIQAIGRDWNEYLSFYFPARSEGVDVRRLPENCPQTPKGKDILSPIDQRKYLAKQNQRYMVYVHSKLMIVDDRFVILGSANINERSMAGNRDTEICTALWPSNNRVEAACEQQVQDELRLPLLREYFGDIIAGPPESAGYRDEFQRNARYNYLALREAQQGLGHLAMFPFDVGERGELVAAAWAGPDLSPTEPHVRVIDSLNVNPVDPERPDAWTWESYIPRAFGAASTLIE
jgi:phosphatidylserine/phosphatidylglycerophosphate/cardiolipin synthase-like enzyme